ncbi:MAG: glucosidase [bacterium]|nr:glucosidase [bacterium]
MSTPEHLRLAADAADWDQWGPFLSERAWGTVREDYSADGDAWGYFPHDVAPARVFRWNEDGLAGMCDANQYMCFALAMWNGQDPILKERLFGLDNHEGNHGEDVKEAYWYLDATPSHSYFAMRYRYPQARFPYDELREESARRSGHDPEYELVDTGIFDYGRFFDVDVEYAKAGTDDIVIRITATNRGPEAARLDLLPTLWFRNTWAWGYPEGPMDDVPERPRIDLAHLADGWITAKAQHSRLGTYHWYAAEARDLWVTNNETNSGLLFGDADTPRYTKDAFHRRLINNEAAAVNPNRTGTKAAAWYRLELASGESSTITLRLSATSLEDPFADVAQIVATRRLESDAFYDTVHPANASPQERQVQRAALAGMIWGKQVYSYDVEQWLDGDPAGPVPPAERLKARNSQWRHFNAHDVLSMPDPWEYPWFAAWDTAFHCLPFGLIDPSFAKDNLRLMTREWYMHPNGQPPAYEWEFGNVNPPVFGWAARRVFELDRRWRGGETDDVFLEAMFHKLLLTFTWWVNRKDEGGNNVFQGGFLGLDNIGLFDRSKEVPGGGHIDQSDGTAWMAFATLGMLRLALELALIRPAYQDIATKFYEHFLAIAKAMNASDHSLWDEEDGFFYDVVHLPDGRVVPLKVRSLVGLISLLGVEVIEPELLASNPQFRSRMKWFSRHRPHLADKIASVERHGVGERVLMSILDEHKLRSVLGYLLDSGEFLSPFGIRSLSKYHQDHPFAVSIADMDFTISYEPGESATPMFGGNSNWRGPIWFPLNYLIIEALREYHSYYGDEFTVELPTGSGNEVTLRQVADELARRLVSLFVPDKSGRRPFNGDRQRLQDDPQWRDLILFHEYFNADTGEGLGASHQTGWTGLVATLIDELGRA